MAFPGSSAGKESACNAGDPCLITGSGRSSGEGIGYPLQYSWASLVAQMVKNLYPVSEVRSCGHEELPHTPKPEARGSSQEEQPHARSQGSKGDLQSQWHQHP